jgi:membrane protein DedA with SNARE-associated domain
VNDQTVTVGYLFGLLGVVASGAVLVAVPTGAAVSIAAALAEQDNLLDIALVIVFGAIGAYVSDLATYAVLRFAGKRASQTTTRLGRWLHKQRQAAALGRVQHRLREHELSTLLLSRLVPGGQLPVLVAAAVGDYSWRRYAIADMGAALLWSAMYAGSGLAGRAVFPEPWEGAAAGIALVLLLTLASKLWTRPSRAVSTPTAPEPEPAGSDGANAES